MSSSKAVNVPVNEKQKEKDVNTKLQFYGISQGTCLCAAPASTPAARPTHLYLTAADVRGSICQWQGPLKQAD